MKIILPYREVIYFQKQRKELESILKKTVIKILSNLIPGDLKTYIYTNETDYYNEYTVYHVETSIYNINEDERKSLVWVGAIDLVDPQTISSTVKNYVSRIIEQLEYENLIKKRSI